MTADLLHRISRALYGYDEAWFERLGTDLNVNPRTVQRWGTGENEVPSGVWGELMELLNERQADLIDLKSDAVRAMIRAPAYCTAEDAERLERAKADSMGALPVNAWNEIPEARLAFLLRLLDERETQIAQFRLHPKIASNGN